jgi:hypothetical protein
MGAKQVKMLRFLDNAEDREALNKAFATYDKDKNGSLSREEFLAFTADLVEYYIKKHPDHKVGDLAVLKNTTEAGKTVTSPCLLFFLFRCCFSCSVVRFL